MNKKRTSLHKNHQNLQNEKAFISFSLIRSFGPKLKIFKKGLALFLSFFMAFSPLFSPLLEGEEISPTLVNGQISQNGALPLKPISPVDRFKGSVLNLQKVSKPVLQEIEKGQVFEDMVSRNEGFLSDFKAKSRQWELDRGLKTGGDEIKFLTGNSKLGTGFDQMSGRLKGGFSGLLSRLKGVRVPGNEKARVEMKGIVDQAESRLDEQGLEGSKEISEELQEKVDSWEKRNRVSGSPKNQLGQIISGLKENVVYQEALASGNRVDYAFKSGGSGSGSVLKSRLSPQSLLLTAGISLTGRMVQSLVKTGRVDFKGAVRAITSAEFAGSVVGAAAGAAAGHFAGTMAQVFIPGLVGNLLGALLPVLGASFTSEMFSGSIGNLKKDKKLHLKEVFKKMDKTQLIGSSVGSTVGAILGSMIPIPIFGTLFGSMVGGWIGGKVASQAKSILQPRLVALKETTFGRNRSKSSEVMKQEASSSYKNLESDQDSDQERSLNENEAAELKGSHDRYLKAFTKYEESLKLGRTQLTESSYRELQKAQSHYYAIRKKSGL